MTNPLAHRVAVVTGAARGVGAGLAEELARRGAQVALVGLEPDGLAAAARRCGPRASWWEADVTDGAALADTAERIAEHHGRIDIAVANAGVATGGPFTDSDPDAFARTLEVNLLGSTLTARAFLPHLLETRGYLLQIASLAALAPAPMMTAYCTSKAGVESFAHALRAELAHRGVGVGVAYLSWTDTDMVRGADRVELLREMRAKLPWPLNRTYPLAPAVVRIADGITRRSSHVYGQRWLRAMQPVRAAIPGMTALVAGRTLRGLEPRLASAGPAGGRLVGAGGQAAEARRPRRT